MWSTMATSAGGRHSSRRPPAALVRNSARPPSRLNVSMGTAIARAIAAFVIMAASLKQRDALALELADDQPPGMPGDRRPREARQIFIGDRDGAFDFVGERPEARAQHHAKGGGFNNAALAQHFDRLVDFGGHDGLSSRGVAI